MGRGSDMEPGGRLGIINASITTYSLCDPGQTDYSWSSFPQRERITVPWQELSQRLNGMTYTSHDQSTRY